jgi:hypothetical protein
MAGVAATVALYGPDDLAVPCWYWQGLFKGHQDAFPPPRLSVRCRFSQGTVAGTRGNGRDAPIPAVRGTEIEWQGSDPKLPFVLRQTSALAISGYLKTLRMV